MGKKQSPILLRLGLNHTWKTEWYDSKSTANHFSQKLHTDFLLRDWINIVYPKVSDPCLLARILPKQAAQTSLLSLSVKDLSALWNQEPLISPNRSTKKGSKESKWFLWNFRKLEALENKVKLLSKYKGEQRKQKRSMHVISKAFGDLSFQEVLENRLKFQNNACQSYPGWQEEKLLRDGANSSRPQRSRKYRQYMKYFLNQHFSQETSLFRKRGSKSVFRFQIKSLRKPQLLRQSLMNQWFHGVLMGKTLRVSRKYSADQKKKYDKKFTQDKFCYIADTLSSYTSLTEGTPLYKEKLIEQHHYHNRRYMQLWTKWDNTFSWLELDKKTFYQRNQQIKKNINNQTSKLKKLQEVIDWFEPLAKKQGKSGLGLSNIEQSIALAKKKHQLTPSHQASQDLLSLTRTNQKHLEEFTDMNTCTNVRIQEKPFQLTSFDFSKLGFGLEPRNLNQNVKGKLPQTRNFNEIQLEILEEKITKTTKNFYKKLTRLKKRDKLFPTATRAKHNVAQRWFSKVNKVFWAERCVARALARKKNKAKAIQNIKAKAMFSNLKRIKGIRNKIKKLIKRNKTIKGSSHIKKHNKRIKIKTLIKNKQMKGLQGRAFFSWPVHGGIQPEGSFPAHQVIIRKSFSHVVKPEILLNTLSRFLISWIKNNQFRGRNLFRKLKKKAQESLKNIASINRKRFKGMVFQFSGRAYGAKKAQSFKISVGSVATSRLKAKIRYTQLTQQTGNGSWGFKLWLANRRL